MRLPLPDAAELLRGAWRTTVLRLALAVAAAVVLAMAVILAMRNDPGQRPLAEPGRTTVLVLDVSSSIEPTRYRQIADALDRARREGGDLGVVLFSDVAYELLPPGTPTAELAGLRRFFTPLPSAVARTEAVEVGATRFPKAPWSEVFSSGTRISTGLRLAAAMLARAGVSNGKVVLVSDLQDEDDDLPALGRALADYAEAGLPLHVVALGSNPADERIFRRLVGQDVVERARRPTSDRAEAAAVSPEPFPLALVVAGVVLALALAANEHFLARLPLQPGEGQR
jgi:hypothetical protein